MISWKGWKGNENRRLVRVKAGSNISIVSLRVVGGDEKRTQRLGVKLGHPVPGGFSNLKQ
jgi:hypothetical protein